ncbi:DUF1294 domain-containing protein [Pseudomonas extremorientalis]|uniref:Uncharacterized membrane protein YsdA, DUF1294 family n=1 Tax=Pseudomonas extremorientalis TaxID=169669 RepID=A0A1H0IMX4_9PSED|nr:DUF1294 domain-containing protein [Pseudomonas extremorientalis]KAB0519817.1 DUF1294 domain-containing protein [Pseudomonas extremorientalis]OIN12734.1 hypothetical protein BFN10_03245 [Pseudomonas extremorientalis]SDO32799.1 Uncharacterized membrane protein YsdA, DUF1294 family [Pseudomonas extremorientalis]
MSIQYPRLKAAIFALLCAAPLIGAALVWYRGETLIPLAAYGVVSVIAFFLYWSDKRKAQTDRWRTPENILHAVELAGGWPGALIAQQVFRHKTRKVSYQVLFWVIVLLHEVFWLDQLFLGGTLLSVF